MCSIEGLESHCDTVKSIGGCSFVPDPDYGTDIVSGLLPFERETHNAAGDGAHGERSDREIMKWEFTKAIKSYRH